MSVDPEFFLPIRPRSPQSKLASSVATDIDLNGAFVLTDGGAMSVVRVDVCVAGSREPDARTTSGDAISSATIAPEITVTGNPVRARFDMVVLRLLRGVDVGSGIIVAWH